MPDGCAQDYPCGTFSCFALFHGNAARRNSKVRKCLEQDSEGRACTKKRRGTFQADACRVQAEPSCIQALPADILLHIFTFTNPKAQREVLPLVCRHWHEVLQGPVALWRHLELDFPAAMDLGLNGASLTPSRRFQVAFYLIHSDCSHHNDACKLLTTLKLHLGRRVWHATHLQHNQGNMGFCSCKGPQQLFAA